MNRIAELKRKRAALFEEMKAFLVEKDSDDAPMSDEDKVAYQAMLGRLDDHDERIERLESLNAKDADESDVVGDGDEDADAVTMSTGKSAKAVGKARGPLIRHSRKHEAKGTQLARFIIGAGIAKASNSLSAGQSYIREQLGDRDVAKALGSNLQSAGGALVPQDFREELVELLNAKSVVRSLGIEPINMPNGNLTLPRMASGSQATWIGENQDIVTSAQTFDDIQLAAKKLAGMVPVSNDLINRAPLSVEQIVRTDMVTQLALAEDLALLTSAGSTYRPKGFTAWAGNNRTATVATLSDVNNLLATMELDLQGNNVSTEGAKWIFHPTVRSFLATLTDSTGRYFYKEELDRGMLFGYEYAVTTQLPTNLGTTNETLMMFVQPSTVILGDTLNMIADSSNEASYIDAGSGLLVSTYSRMQTVFRVVEEIDMAVRHPQAISVSTVAGMHPSFYSNFTAGAPYVTQPASTTPSSAQSAAPTG